MGGDDFSQQSGNRLRGIELPGFLTCARGELTNQVLVGITQNIGTCFAQVKAQFIEFSDDFADQLIFRFRGVAKLARA